MSIKGDESRNFSPRFFLSIKIIVSRNTEALSDDFRNLICQKWWHGITDLLVLGCAVPLKEVIIGEGLQTRGFADRQAAALLKIRVNEIMAILRYMRRDGRRGMIIQLDTETIRKLHGF